MAAELTPTTVEGYIYHVAPKYGLDPAAVLAVASMEGLGGGIGDSGTSFGPWQLHAGGALPPSQYHGPYSQETNAWAWSSEGVDYALSQIQAVAHGLSGQSAIDAIVTGFERPANPAKEILGASAAYRRFAGGSAGSASPPLGGLPSSGGSTTTTQAGGGQAQLAGFDIFGGLKSTVFEGLLRLVFVLGATGLVGLGLVLIVRAFTGQTIVKEAAGAVALVPKGVGAAQKRSAQRRYRHARAQTGGKPPRRERISTTPTAQYEDDRPRNVSRRVEGDPFEGL